MCCGHTPLFSGQSALPSLPIYHHCTALVPTHLQILEKKIHFQPCFGQNFSSQDAIFPNFCPQDPSFFKENPLPRPYFWKPVWHAPTKKKVECSPPPPDVFATFAGQLSHLDRIWRFGCVKYRPKLGVQIQQVVYKVLANYIPLQVGKNWVCICKFGCVKNTPLHGWLAKPLSVPLFQCYLYGCKAVLCTCDLY